MADSFGTRYIDAWNTHDPAVIGGLMADDVDFEDIALGAVFHSRKEVEVFAGQVAEGFSTDYRFALVTEFTTADSFCAEWTMTGTHDRDSPEMPATGKQFTIRGATIGRLDDGKMTYDRDYWDMAGLLRQIGALPG
jgi:steroid delta-isomerase-like uncharacterized protein